MLTQKAVDDIMSELANTTSTAYETLQSLKSTRGQAMLNIL